MVDHDGHGIGLEQIRGHPGAVADIVADIVRDGRRVAWIVLRNSGLDLADEIGADIGSLGEDAAAETRKDGNQRCSEAEGDERVDHRPVRRRVPHADRQHRVVDRDGEQGETRDQHARHRAGTEGDLQARPEAFACRLRGPDIGAHGHQHADEPGRARERRADQKADPDRNRKQERHQHEDHDARNRYGGVLPREIGRRAFLNRRGDFLHAGVAGIGGHDRLDRPDAIYDGQRPTGDDAIECHVHDGPSPVSCSDGDGIAGRRRTGPDVRCPD